VRHRPVILAVLVTLLAAAPSASAQAPEESVQEGLREQSCRALTGGTVNAPDQVATDPSGGLPASWSPAPAGLLPDVVALRSETTSFNRLFDFATRGGNIYARERAAGAQADGPSAATWRQLPLPPCFAGRVTSIGADDDELIALDAGRHVYTLDNILKDPTLWTWSSRWGTPFWTGPGYVLPGTVAWSWTVVSPVEDKTWTDPAGNATPVGTFKVSHIWGLRDGGQRLTFWDPWLPLDESYEMCGPHRGRFRSIALSTSGSEVVVLGAHGDLFTRLYDFDLSGHDPIFFSYAYEDQRGKGDGSPIQLPAEPWVQQPKIPGAITSAISVHKTGSGSLHRVVRVEGVQAGRNGYWERDIAAPVAAGWAFHATGLALERALLATAPGDTSLLDLGPSEERRYIMEGGAVTGELEDFSVYCSPARLRIRQADGSVSELILHHVDGLRQQVRSRGLDDEPRTQNGAIEGPKGRFEAVTVRATRSEIVVQEKGWRFRLADPLPLPARRCLPAAATVGGRSIGVVALGARQAALLAALPAPTRRGKRAWRWCVEGGGRVGAAFDARGRVVLVRTSAPGHALRGTPGRRGATGTVIAPGARSARLGRAFPRRRSLGAGLIRTTPTSPRVVVVRGGRVRALAVASRGTLVSPRLLRARLRAAGA